MKFILGIFTTREAINWMKKCGRPEIDAPHFPIGWIPLSLVADIHAAVKIGEIKLVDLPARVNSNRTATFIVKNNK